MNILLNFFPVRSGGGQQVASSFLKIISQHNFEHSWYVFVGEDSELHNLSNELLSKEYILSLKYSYLSRLTNKKSVSKFVKQNGIDMIYNFTFVLSIKNIPQVVRSVYSNLYFPEINFWGCYSKLTQAKKKVIDHFRLNKTLAANGIVFENKSMLSRSVELFSYPIEDTIYVEPSVSYFHENLNNPVYNHLGNIRDFKILYLSSWHLNKNITILPKVALLLKNINVKIKFILSLEPENNDVKKYLISQIEKLNVPDYFEFIGKVKAIHVHQVVKSCNAMILLSKLECFSSNIIEAFYFKKTLIISDEPWSRSVCLNAVSYVDRNDENIIKNSILELVNNETRREELILAGTRMLDLFNTPFEKVAKQVKFIEQIYEKYYKKTN